MSDQRLDITITAAAATQFSYHVRMSAVFAVAGESAESASEAVLAWAILASMWPDADGAAASVAAELVEQTQVGTSAEHRALAHRKAHALALSLESHYVSCGQHDVAALYERVADALSDTISALSNS